MPQSLARIWLHIVFSTKERRAYLQNADIRDEMFRMLGTTPRKPVALRPGLAVGSTMYTSSAGSPAP